MVDCFQWTDGDIWVEFNNYQWGESPFGYLEQIWTDENYVYAAISVGLSIVDLESEQEYAYLNYDGGFNTVWGNTDTVYLGTNNDGIKYINKTCISGSISEPVELSNCLNDYVGQTLTADKIRYIHGNNEFLMCCTSIGVDVIKEEPHGYRSYTTVSGARKCFMTSTGKFYYSTYDGVSWELHRVNVPLTDWSIPSYTYGDPLIASNEITDMFVTEGTTSNGIDNTIFCATSSGVYVIDEETNTCRIYYAM